MSQSVISSTVTVTSKNNRTYSEIAAKQYDLAPMSSIAYDGPKITNTIPNIAARTSSRVKSALRSWIPTASLSTSKAPAPMHTPVAASTTFKATPFDRLFSKKVELIAKSPAVAKETSKPLISVLRASVAKSCNAQLLLPDFLLNRLIQSNPAISTLVHNQLASSQTLQHSATRKRTQRLTLNY